MPNYFAAIPVELPQESFRALRELFPPDTPLRWIASQDLHLTLAFFGSYQPEKLPAVIAALETLPLPDFHVLPAEVLRLPSVRRCSAIALGVTHAAPLCDYLKHCHATLMQAAGLEPEGRDPLPHITFARPDRRRLTGALPGAALPPLLSSTQIHLHRLAVYGWAADRSARQFQRLYER